MSNRNTYVKLKEIYLEVKNHSDLTYKSIPFFVNKMKEIRVELMKVAIEQGEQITRDVSDAQRLIVISEREDLNNIQSYPKEVPKYLERAKVSILSSLSFANK